MRSVLVVVATVAACDGAPNMDVDAGVDGRAIDASIDAALGIDGTWLDTYLTVNGPVSMSVCGSAPTAIVVDQTTAAVTPYTGACKGDGSWRINAPGNLGTYYLRVQGSLYETTKHAGIDLSTDRLGRNDVGAVAGVNLDFTMTGLDAWASGDVLMAFGANIGFYQNLSFSTGGPTTGGTTLVGTAPWFGYKVDAAKSDQLQIVQLGVHSTTNGLSYLSLDRAYDVPAFTMTNNGTHTIGGTLTGAPPGTLALDVNVSSFNQFATVANPNVASRTIAGSAYAAASAEVLPSPSLISFARDSSSVSALDFGTLGYGDPFPTAWQRYVKIQEAFAVPYTWNNVTGSLNAQMTRTMTKAEAEATVIDAKLGPPQNPTFDGVDAFTATNISPVPIITWDAPSLGTPTDYDVLVYEVQISGTALKFISTLRLSTKQTSVRIPAGYLLGQRQYVFVIRARTRDNSDLYMTPLRSGKSTSTAETLTALVTTDS
ncbi:MAG TPA: hypothetical protein VIV11_35220 [Kofleriaceae bacterium]